MADLDNPEKYKSKKDRYNRIKAPKAYADKNGLKFAVREKHKNMQEVLHLYDKWVEQKVERGVFRVNFPVARYRHCITRIGKVKNLVGVECRDKDKNLIAYRVVYLDKLEEGLRGYDLAFFSDLGITQISSVFNYMSLYYMREMNDLKSFNCGLSGGSLKDFKKRYPHTVRESYATQGQYV